MRMDLDEDVSFGQASESLSPSNVRNVMFKNCSLPAESYNRDSSSSRGTEKMLNLCFAVKLTYLQTFSIGNSLDAQHHPS